MRVLRAVFCMLLVASMAAMGVASLLAPDEAISLNDNRTLQGLPKFTLGGFADGSLYSGYEGYSLDHGVGRDAMIGCYYRVQELIGKQERNGCVECTDDQGVTRILGARDVILDPEKVVAEQQAAAQAWMESWLPLKEAVEGYGGHLLLRFLYTSDYHASALPWYYDRTALAGKTYHEAIVHNTLGYQVADADPLMEAHRGEKLYFNTDHHYTELGAYYAYLALLDKAGELFPDVDFSFPAWDDMQHWTITETMQGSSLRVIGLSGRVFEDELIVALPKDYPTQYVRSGDGGEVDDRPLIDLTQDWYGAFCQGDSPLVVVDTFREELPDLLFIGNSHANALEPLAAYNFNRMSSLDSRTYNHYILSYVEEQRPELVVLVADVLPQRFWSDEEAARVLGLPPKEGD